MTSPRLGPAYWRLWIASAVSNTGDGVLMAALPLLAARLSASPFDVGLVSTLFTLPWLLIAVPAGAHIDRADRRRVLVVADGCRGALIGAAALLAASGELRMWMLWVLAFGLGIGEVFFDSASQTILPALVSDEQLERANGWRYSVEVATNTFVGLPIGGFLFAASIWLPFGVDAASFVVAAALAASLRGSFRATTQEAPSTRRSDIAGAFRWLWVRPLLRNLALSIALTNLALGAVESTFVLFATRELGVSERSFGLIFALIGGAGIAAGMLGGRLVDRVGRRFVVLVAAIAPAVTMLAIGTIAVTWWVVLMTAVQVLMVTLWSVVAVSLRQRLIPDHLFGRVNGVYRWFSWGALPIGALAGGAVASWWGLRAPYFFAAAIVTLAYLLVVFTLTDEAVAAAQSSAAASGTA